jgi:hypothetical protein
MEPERSSPYSQESATCSYPEPDKWVPVTTAWRFLGLRMEERPLGMERGCEYIE